MAFNGVGRYSLSAPNDTGINIDFAGTDHGSQWIMADPVGIGAFKVDHQTKERYLEGGQLKVIYRVNVQCVRDDGIGGIFTLQGGGNV